MNKVATNIDQMPAGREMDSLVAERVMRIAVFNKQYSPSIQIPCPDNKPGCMVAHFKPVPRYSTNMADAWEVAEEMRITVTPSIGRGWKAAWCNASGSGETNWVGLTNRLTILISFSATHFFTSEA